MDYRQEGNVNVYPKNSGYSGNEDKEFLRTIDEDVETAFKKLFRKDTNGT